MRRKSLLIGKNQLEGCHQDVRNMVEFLKWQGYPDDERSMIVLADDREGQFYPNGYNILAAMDWLVSEPNTSCFLHYSGHGGQVQDADGDRASGFDDTIVPVDFEEKGQIDSGILHRHLVSALAPGSQLHVILDCCHSGSALELPFVYRSDENGNVNMIDNLKQGMRLVAGAQHLIQGGFSYNKLQDAQQLYAGAQSLFNSLKHMGESTEDGVGAENFQEHWETENKQVIMFSGCRDDQTSADASVAGGHVGAMSWAFLETMKDTQGQASYLQILQVTREKLQGKYSQVPQLSMGTQMDLNQALAI